MGGSEGTGVAPTTIDIAQARRIAIAAQGLDRAAAGAGPGRARAAAARGAVRRRPVTASDIAAVIRKLALVQLDFVNVIGPAHYQVIFSRLGAYERKLLDDLIYRSGQFTEQWAHEASIIPVETWPLLRHRMAVFRLRPWGIEKRLKQHPGYPDAVLEEIRNRGPLGSHDLHVPAGVERKIENSWHGSVPRATLEMHFARGLLAIADRIPGFARIYELSERHIAAEHHAREVSAHEAQRELLGQSARALGIATGRDLADYFRMKMGEASPRIKELVESGELREVRVEGWREVAYLSGDAKVPRAVHGCALLSPFDPLVWFRPRLLRLFDYDYRFEIFVPDHKRKWGVYVLPFLYGDRLVARVDLKADRTRGRLIAVKKCYERGCKTREISAALDAEIRALAEWSNLCYS